MNRHSHTGAFTIVCCGWRRSVLPGGVIVCTRCDYATRDGLSTIPNEVLFTAVPAEMRVWYVPPMAT